MSLDIPTIQIELYFIGLSDEKQMIPISEPYENTILYISLEGKEPLMSN
jgi:hypothetical protein